MHEPPFLIYLHGFNSSPLSEKAQITARYVQQVMPDVEIWIPQLPHSLEALQAMLVPVVEERIKYSPVYLIGSSLGGFIGTWLQNHLLTFYPESQVRLALLNPAVRPWELLPDYVGKHVNSYTGEEWVLTMEEVDYLHNMVVGSLIDPASVLLLVQKGDETLDYQQALDFYAECPFVVQEDGSHAFDRYEQLLPVICDFLQQGC
ncbi:hypothetical protein CI610_01019 [invertebrate metagenome]|uniref:Esterase YqiA n=1 Tax=invertebrate metagenome TaxID=1711999 RepID=A0A2H9T9R2_9ZZZZ